MDTFKAGDQGTCTACGVGAGFTERASDGRCDRPDTVCGSDGVVMTVALERGAVPRWAYLNAFFRQRTPNLGRCFA